MVIFTLKIELVTLIGELKLKRNLFLNFKLKLILDGVARMWQRLKLKEL